jgi:host cell factor
MTWYQGPEGGNAPLGRLNHSASLIGTKMYIFGGWNKDVFFNDLFVLDLAAMAWTQPETSGPAPLPRMGHVATVVGTNVLIQGGFYYDKSQVSDKMGSRLKESYLNDLRVLDTESFVWSRLRVSGVPPRHCYGHSMDISGSDILVFGGYGVFQKVQGDVTDYFVILDTDTMTWNRVPVNGAPPQQRYGHTSTPIGPHLLVFGGWEKMKAMNDVFVIRDLSAVPNKNE